MTMLELAPNRHPIRVGQAVRVGPGIGDAATACFWRFWVEGSEIYAASRSGGHQTKISVHASGEIHMARGPRNNQMFHPLMPVGDDWAHAVEIRFLLGRGAFSPPPAMTRLKKKTDKALLVQVPGDHVLILNLLVGKLGTALPLSFVNAGQIWRRTLKDGRSVVLVGRLLPMDEENAKQLKFIRTELNPRANLSGNLIGEPPYIECLHTFWGPGGNVVFVVPMGKEGYRFEGEDDPEPEPIPRPLQITCPDSAIPISAPDGAAVGTLSIKGNASEIMLVKNTNVIAILGTATLSIDIAKLRFGETFARPKVGIACPPTIGGCQPRAWEYPVDAKFDGETLTIELGINSAGFRKREGSPVVDALNDGEELIVRAPEMTVKLSADRTNPVVSAAFQGSVRLRDISSECGAAPHDKIVA